MNDRWNNARILIRNILATEPMNSEAFTAASFVTTSGVPKGPDQCSW
jgi:hypothetical protein